MTSEHLVQSMTTFKAAFKLGTGRGPVQIGFARSIGPVKFQEVTITRVAITTEKDAENKSTEMGRKSIVPYGLYRVEGYIPLTLHAELQVFSEDDLELLWRLLLICSNMIIQLQEERWRFEN